jgi:hypothetical protein
MAFGCDVCGARFEAEDTSNNRPDFNTLWIAAKKLACYARQQRGGKWPTAGPECAPDDWTLWNWK